jgi:hypothetical protein
MTSGGGPESARLLAEINHCGFYILNGVSVPITSSVPKPVYPKYTPSSLRTSQIIQATLLASVDPNDAATRFTSLFPPPVPPPQFLQPEFVKYRINYEPVTRQKPCIGFRYVEP